MQPDIARVLHSETDGLEVCWKGDRWRDFPQPQAPTPIISRAGGAMARCNHRARILGAIGHTWKKREAIQAETQTTNATVREYLTRLLKAGHIERQIQPGGGMRGRPQMFYRRRQA